MWSDVLFCSWDTCLQTSCIENINLSYHFWIYFLLINICFHGLDNINLVMHSPDLCVVDVVRIVSRKQKSDIHIILLWDLHILWKLIHRTAPLKIFHPTRPLILFVCSPSSQRPEAHRVVKSVYICRYFYHSWRWHLISVSVCCYEVYSSLKKIQPRLIESNTSITLCHRRSKPPRLLWHMRWFSTNGFLLCPEGCVYRFCCVFIDKWAVSKSVNFTDTPI